MELTLIVVFLGIIAATEIGCFVLNIRNKHLAEELRTAEKACATHAENATTVHRQMVENSVLYRRQIDALTAKVTELTAALEKAKKQE